VEGGGIGLIARPAGACVIKDGVVRWQPAFDLNRTVGLVAGLAAVWPVAEAPQQRQQSAMTAATDASCDAAVLCLVMCSLPDRAAALAEAVELRRLRFPRRGPPAVIAARARH